MKYSILLFTALFLFINGNSSPTRFSRKADNLLQLNSGALKFNATVGCHSDSIHDFNFRYPYKRRGLKPYIIPAALITTGTALAFTTDIKENIRDFAQEHLAYSGRLDDYIPYAPFLAVYALNAAGVKGKNNFGNRTSIAGKSILLRHIIVTSLKSITKVRRPNGDMRAFPSGHTSFAFTMAHFMHKEFGEKSYWYSFGAYSAATSVGFIRMARNAHWVSDVVAGAGIGILCTELIYLTHQYKWDRQHLKKLDIFPFQSKHQKGVAFVYTF